MTTVRRAQANQRAGEGRTKKRIAFHERHMILHLEDAGIDSSMQVISETGRGQLQLGTSRSQMLYVSPARRNGLLVPSIGHGGNTLSASLAAYRLTDRLADQPFAFNAHPASTASSRRSNNMQSVSHGYLCPDNVATLAGIKRAASPSRSILALGQPVRVLTQ